MTLRSISLALLFVFMVSPGIAAQGPNGPIYGDGLTLLAFDSEPDENGLIWTIHEPESAEDQWAVSVFNASDATVSDLTVTIEYLLDGKWSVSGMDNAELAVLPATIEHGGIGFQLGEELGSTPSAWTDVRVRVDAVTIGASETVVPIGIEDLQEESDGGWSGMLVNNSSKSVTEVGITFACVDAEGRITHGSSHDVDLRRTMDPNDRDPFNFSGADGECEADTEVIVTAAGKVEEA